MSLLMALTCDARGALAELAVARELYAHAVALGRVAQENADLPQVVEADVRSILKDCAA
jgi:hypothetical protein